MAAHDLAQRLIEQSRSVGPIRERTDDRSQTAMDLLYHRLRPVIGARGFHALFLRAAGDLTSDRAELARLCSSQTAEQGLRDLEQALRDASSPDDSMRTLLVSVLSTLERLVGPDLVERLVIAELDDPQPGSGNGR